MEASEGATGFGQSRDYPFSVLGEGIFGDLGAFWHTEISEPAGDEPIVVGPVAATDPALPVFLELQHDRGVLGGVTAVMATGDSYVFEVVNE